MSEIEFDPIGDRIVVQPWEDEEIVSKSGFILSTRDAVNKELPQFGEIVAIGTGKTFPDCPNPADVFSVGEFIVFNKYAGDEMVFNTTGDSAKGKKYIVLRLDAVYGKIKDSIVQRMKDERDKLKKLAEGINTEDVHKPDLTATPEAQKNLQNTMLNILRDE